MSFTPRRILAAALLAAVIPAASPAGTCDGQVIGVRPISAYNHAAGNGFLAVRSGPGGDYAQVGEVYLGDWSIVFEKRGNWYRIGCYEGRCTNPLWGQPSPEGWVYGKYLDVGGVCDHLN